MYFYIFITVLTLFLFISSSLPVEFLYCDLASMKSIRQFVQQFRAKNCPLHVLVNNGEFHFLFTYGEDVTNGALTNHLNISDRLPEPYTRLQYGCANRVVFLGVKLQF